jgi:uncharacterized protein (UPF0548 family)
MTSTHDRSVDPLSIVTCVTHSPFWFRRPNEEQLEEVLAAQSKRSVTYGSSDLVRAETPRGFRETGGLVTLGHGQRVFDRAIANIKNWSVHERAGLNVTPPRSEVRESSDVILLMKLLVGYVTVSCRVVSITESKDQWGFNYGTLPHHVERGEESFTVARAPDDTVTFAVRAMSRPAHFLTKMGAPVARIIQRKATDRYLQAMVDLVQERTP